MLSKEKIARINELANKSKSETLSLSEQQEQKELREEYLQAFRGGMRNHIEGMKVVDNDGTDVTPEKLKQIQKEKGLHDR
ncbi:MULTISPECIES: DUF896 family protein [Carnobacterium]|uniref:UPF0291 protein IV74_GL001327 n=2 Tax=Carnobacterium divergens TaxID=2748 RepID=A0A0R2I2F1_CARDV|nr:MULTISPECIES: DUF896 family protein [Carnobacterium]ANZ99777.1 hypothetical protein BFC22_06565 [Carnobacterium divergens]KRN56215.1 hypothetical protein IV74_GL001327 [Carnobacterium divergens DSM 20623]MCO6017951.1 DUF896 family protein [Carnobacterium divergens]MDO0875194.1 DUF896 family protein [Carnobacterium divergens]MDT1938692.1 DUF896 family protein [Carnobacterium divergens]